MLKSAGRISRPDYECGNIRRVEEEFQDHTLNVEVYKECRNILRPDKECGSVRRVHQEFQDQTSNVEACEECSKKFETRL